MSHIVRTLAFAAAAGLALPASAVAQGSPPLATMPMPPSASDPAPKDKAKPGAAAKPTAAKPRKKTEASEASDGGRNAAAAQPYQRPGRYVPEEFDRAGKEDGSRAKPIVTEGGRAGMGMRF